MTGAPPAIAAPFFATAVPLQRRPGFRLAGAWRAVKLTADADPSPLAHETPRAEQIRLHVEAIKAAHVPGRIGARQRNRRGHD